MKKRFGENVLVGQSGGPTSAINATLAGVINGCLGRADIGKVYGMSHGIKGILKEELYDLGEIFKDRKGLDILIQTPAAALGSCRYKLPDNDDFYEELMKKLEKYSIGYFFYIGGNDSMDTVNKISGYARREGYDLRVVGIPKTIDNDLEGTDHTPGFGSAAKYVAAIVAETRRDTAVYDDNSVTIIEVMGRDAGWLTASAALACGSHSEGADLIYLPEVEFSTECFYEDLEDAWGSRTDLLVVVSEGIKDGTGYIGARTSEVDKFGHVALSGAGKVLEGLVKDKFKCKVRSIELNTPQRSAGHILSATDIEESYKAGEYAVSAAAQGSTGIMVSMVRKSSDPYEYAFAGADVGKIANRVKKVPREYINRRGNNITPEGVRYLRPLIMGEWAVRYSGGVPEHFILPETKKNLIK